MMCSLSPSGAYKALTKLTLLGDSSSDKLPFLKGSPLALFDWSPSMSWLMEGGASILLARHFQVHTVQHEVNAASEGVEISIILPR